MTFLCALENKEKAQLCYCPRVAISVWLLRFLNLFIRTIPTKVWYSASPFQHAKYLAHVFCELNLRFMFCPRHCCTMSKNIQTREKSAKTHIQHFVTGTLIFNGYFNNIPEVLYSGRASNKTITINGIYVNRNGKQWDDLWTTKSVISQDSNNIGNSRRSKISGDILKSETMPICTVSRSFWSINHICRSFSNVESK